MNKIGVCLLGHGHEHIDECNFLIDKLSKYKSDIKIYIATNFIERINTKADKIILIDKSFNYNLKRVSVREALKECDIVIIIDSDNCLYNAVNFLDLYNLDDGMYSKVIKKEYTRDYTNEYQKILYEYNDNNDLFHLHEYFLILKLMDKNKKQDFIDNWDFLHEVTEDVQPIGFDGVSKGSMEGLILYVSCVKSGIKTFDAVENEKLLNFFNSFYHYFDSEDKGKIFKKKLI